MLRQTLRHSSITRTSTLASINSTITRRFYEPDNSIPDNKHTTEKDHKLDVQTETSKDSRAERQAVSDNIPNRSGPKQDPKKDHPKAPGPVIGMQDERGGKGH